MPIVLLLLGVVTTAAGLVLVGSGFRDGAFQTDVLTPGTIAAVGGLLLIAFGLAVREMRRIEQSFAARSASRAPRLDDAAAAVAAFSAAAPPSLAEEKHEPPPLPAAPGAPEPHADEAVIERLRAKIPTIPRVENGRLTETADLSQALRETAGLDESAEVRGVAAMARAANGSAAAVRSMPRLDLKPRLATAAPDKAKVSVFNTFWPAAPRRDKEAGQPAAPAISSPPQEPRPAPDPAHAAAAPAATHATAPVSVLKSGVVEGMAYTLYSDGSIEAQLPQGTLRFGSISALRSHIENAP